MRCIRSSIWMRSWSKFRTDHVVVNRPVYIAMAVDVDGRKHVLGLWLGKGDEGAKFWLGVITELKNRGVTDVLVVCCDGLTGFADPIEAVWPNTTVQTCVVHLIRNSIRLGLSSSRWWRSTRRTKTAPPPISKVGSGSIRCSVSPTPPARRSPPDYGQATRQPTTPPTTSKCWTTPLPSFPPTWPPVTVSTTIWARSAAG